MPGRDESLQRVPEELGEGHSHRADLAAYRVTEEPLETIEEGSSGIK